ncbi:DUF2332 family protein [Porphyrobacter algicida]|uniref:DUF2332 family protein n=1 Tax=Qipengyuania algicida TaxID=1836209 RepID=A0A845ACZ8_9SPHN|nr:DUF2332 domain-containing protein [Qipengyuania algicida]MXP27259.1 DUF2332 family protein [Qipengyuania algicida]
MAVADVKYNAIDPLATGADAIVTAFENQVAYCRDNGAPNTALICQALAEIVPGERGGTVMLRIRKWAGQPLADALPLRIAGGLHAIYLKGLEPELSPIYEGHAPTDAAERVADALERHEAFLMPWLDGPPQTNEAGRSWGFAAAMLWLGAKGLPRQFALWELGSSAGINLMMRRYKFDLGGVEVGPETSRMRITPEWHGDAPPAGDFDIVEATGCDVAPVDLTDEAQALRLKAYIWPELTERFARFDAAVEAVNRFPPEIERCRAGDFVERVLAREPQPGVTRMIMHSVVWQYIPQEERERITAMIEDAGKQATAEAPLAWVSLEANRDTHRHELMVRYWPGGDEAVKLATAHPHGSKVSWER